MCSTPEFAVSRTPGSDGSGKMALAQTERGVRRRTKEGDTGDGAEGEGGEEGEEGEEGRGSCTQL